MPSALKTVCGCAAFPSSGEVRAPLRALDERERDELGRSCARLLEAAAAEAPAGRPTDAPSSRQRRAAAGDPRGRAQRALGSVVSSTACASAPRASSPVRRSTRRRRARAAQRARAAREHHLLGEDVPRRTRRERSRRSTSRSSTGIAERGLRVNVALKLTHLGLLLDEELAYANVGRLVDLRAARDNFIRLDMEQLRPRRRDARHLPPAARGGRDARRRGAPGLPLPHARRPRGAARRSQPNLRLVKGAYLEPASVAYPRQGRRRRRLPRG